VVIACALLVTVACESAATPRADSVVPTSQQEPTADHRYLGMWVTADGRIRQQLLPSGRYDEARGARESAYTGRYEVRGSNIQYWDDSGFTADGVFVTENELHHGGMIFYRQPQ
jgi:hypothetical protein